MVYEVECELGEESEDGQDPQGAAVVGQEGVIETHFLAVVVLDLEERNSSRKQGEGRGGVTNIRGLENQVREMK